MVVNKKSIYVAVTFLDFLLFNASFIGAALLAQPSEFLFANSNLFILLLLLNVFLVFYTSSIGFYEEFLTRPFPVHLFNIFKLVILVTIISVLFLFLIKENLYTRNFIFLIFILSFFSITIRTILFKGILKVFRHKGKSIRNLLIIGAEDTGKKFRDIIVENPEIGYRFIGFIDHQPGPGVIGKINELDKIIKESKVEEVVIAVSNGSNYILDDIVSVCNKNAVRIHIIPDYIKFLSSRFQISTVSNIPVITIRDEPLNEVIKRFIKRSFDIIFSLFIIFFLLSWLLPILALLIILDSRGPVFFVQERFGVRNRKFKCYKFRTLINSQVDKGKFNPVLADNDPRITRVGRILRKTNIDELPQFINVLKGDMSVVGPRPHAVVFDLNYEKYFEEIKMRYNVRPGITGWAQINGLRGDVADEEENKKRTLERMKFDLWYIENWSMKLDFQIILLTVWKMIKGDTKGM